VLRFFVLHNDISLRDIKHLGRRLRRTYLRKHNNEEWSIHINHRIWDKHLNIVIELSLLVLMNINDFELQMYLRSCGRQKYKRDAKANDRFPWTVQRYCSSIYRHRSQPVTNYNYAPCESLQHWLRPICIKRSFYLYVGLKRRSSMKRDLSAISWRRLQPKLLLRVRPSAHRSTTPTSPLWILSRLCWLVYLVSSLFGYMPNACTCTV
jgi:hypothetical protein